MFAGTLQSLHNVNVLTKDMTRYPQTYIDAQCMQLLAGRACRYAPWPPADVGAALHAVDRRILAAPELTAQLLTAVSAMAAGAPSSMLPTAMLRLWTRATALEVAGGVHNGARDAALQAAVDLLASPPPPMCAPGAGASQYELAVGMKESHAWARLKVLPKHFSKNLLICSGFGRALCCCILSSPKLRLLGDK